jgi:putative ABC transport system permease protein
MNQFTTNFKKQKVVGFLNICSLSLGVMVAIIVGIWAMGELSFDNFHRDSERLYRINLYATLNNQQTKLGSTFKPLGDEAKAQIPQIEEFVRVNPNRADLGIDNRVFPGLEHYMADANFFTFFNFPLIDGNPETVINAPDKVVVSETAVKKYFDGKNPVGQVVRIGALTFTVSGIMRDMPKNSSLQNDFVFPFYGFYGDDCTWGSNDGFLTFFRIRQDADIKQIESEMTQIVHKNMPMMRELGGYYSLELLSEMHFSQGFLIEQIVKGNRSLMLIFILIAAVILVISCINFTNLFVSTSFLRAKTIGIKKAHGADKAPLIAEFYRETACYVLISVAAGIFLAYLTLPVFNSFVQSRVEINPMSPALYLFITVLFVATVLIAGSFPALYMTKFNPVETLVGKFRGKNISALQKSLIIVQFTASIVFIIVVIFMQKQVDFMVNHDLGFNKENVICVTGRNKFCTNFKTFRDEMLKEPSIKDITLKNSLPHKWTQGWTINKPGTQEPVLMEICRVKANYFDFMNMQIIEGENPFWLEARTDSVVPVVLNESAVRLLELKNPVNQEIIPSGDNGRMVVKGVMKNAHIRSLRDEIDPQVYRFQQDDAYNVLFFKVHGDPQRAIAAIRDKWNATETDVPFEYHFLDDDYAALYASERNAEKIIVFAMFITLLISIAGLFAMAFYITQRRIREIALRKVNGATLQDLLLLLNRDFIVWVGVSFLIACPVAYIGLQRWLDGFTVHTALSLWIFLAVGILALIIALLTTSMQTWKAAQTNPVKILKT